MRRLGKSSNKWAKAAHIKSGSYGSTNEISVSVLDAKKQAVDAEQGEAPHKLLGVIPLFTIDRSGASNTTSVPSKTLVSGPDQQTVVQSSPTKAKGAQPKESASSVSGQAKSAPKHQKIKEKKPLFKKSPAANLEPYEQKAEKKKAARLRNKIIVAVVCLIVAAGAIALVGHYLYVSQQEQQSRVAIVENALSQIEQADQTLTKLNDALANPKAEDAKNKLTALQADLPSASLSLQRAKSLVTQGIEGLQDGYDKEAALRAKKAVEARLTMIEEGQALVDSVLLALDAGSQLNEAWNTIIQADSAARSAAELLMQPTPENLDAAVKGTNEAIALLSSARKSLNDVPFMEGVSVEKYLAYVDKRKEALGFAASAISALKAEDLDNARALQDSYAQADAEAVVIASDLPMDASSAVYEVYQSKAQSHIEKYEEARSAAGSADIMLREYYGGQHK